MLSGSGARLPGQLTDLFITSICLRRDQNFCVPGALSSSNTNRVATQPQGSEAHDEVNQFLDFKCSQLWAVLQ